jgi:polysaccharide biosynthesis protein VpsQ
MIVIARLIITIVPFTYMYLIWQQTSHFDPESVSSLATVLNSHVILAIGAALELGHLFEFGILYFLLILALLSYVPLNKWMEVMFIIFAILYGLMDEIHQIFVPFRTFSIFDLIKDAIGVIVIAYLIHKNYFKSQRSRLGLFLRNTTSFFHKDRGQSFIAKNKNLF